MRAVPSAAAMAGAVLLGAMISLMIMVNGRLSQEAGQNSALLIIHLTGLSAVQLIISARTGRIFLQKHLQAEKTRMHPADAENIYPRTAHISREAAEHPAGEEVSVHDSSLKTRKKRIPPLLNFFGQITAALIIDALLFDMFSMRRLWGAVLILAGIAVNVYIDKKRKRGTQS